MIARVDTRGQGRTAGSRRSPDDAGRGRHPVYEQIKADILSLALPPSQEIDEVSLSKRYGVSRTPVREALIRLATEHLVEVGQSRVRVSALILADYPRFMEALDLTRRAVARLAAHRRHDTDIAKIAAAEAAFATVAKGTQVANDAFARRLGPLETAFHVAIAEAGHNRYLTESYGRLLTVGHRMLHLPYAYQPRSGVALEPFAQSVVAGHRRLVTAIERGRADAAEAVAEALTADLVRRIRGYLEENLSTGVAVTCDLAEPAFMTTDRTNQTEERQ